MLAPGRTLESQPWKWPLLRKEMSPLELLNSRAFLAAAALRHVPTVAAATHSSGNSRSSALSGTRCEQLKGTFKSHRNALPKPAEHLGVPLCAHAVSEGQESTPQGRQEALGYQSPISPSGRQNTQQELALAESQRTDGIGGCVVGSSIGPSCLSPHHRPVSPASSSSSPSSLPPSPSPE